MGDIQLSRSERILRSKIQRYDHDKYWRYRAITIDPTKGTRLGDLWRLLYIKRADAFNNASMGTHRNFGARFATPPHLPHGLNGIVISHNAIVGAHCTIFHQVTIGEGKNGAPTIGNNVMIGAGAKLIGGIHIGDNVKIGAGCIVTEDVPSGATVVMERPRMIMARKEEQYGG